MSQSIAWSRWALREQRQEELPSLLSPTLRTEPVDRGHNTWSYLTSLLRRVGFVLLPSFLQARLRRHNTTRKVHPTAYLDGLRGVASLFVVLDHTMGMFHQSLHFGYVIGAEGRMWFLQLPVIRLVHTGSAMVAVFFVVSGYVNSAKPLKLMKEHDFAGMHKSMSSSIFRRGVRLYLPALATSFIVMLWTYMGILEHDESLPFPYYPGAPPFQTLYCQFSDWTRFVGSLIWPWDWSRGLIQLPYGFHLWTVPVEYRCSMVLSLVLTGLARMHRIARLSLLSALTLYCLGCGRWDVFLFLSGMFIAETQQRPSEPASSRDKQRIPRPNPHQPKRNRMLWIAVFLVGLYLMNQPQDGTAQSPGYISLNAAIPSRIPERDRFRFWVAVGAVLLVWSMSFLEPVQRLFSHPVALYLGDISYALYLVHIAVMRCLAYRILPVTWSLTGFEKPYQYEAGYILGMVFIYPFIFAAADLTWRLIDLPSLQFARWLEAKLVE